MRTLISRALTLCLASALIAGCSLMAERAFEREYGDQEPNRYDHSVPATGAVSYQHQIKPIIESRCVACHACYDAPCQLKLGSWQGIARGLSPAQVYDGTRLTEAPLTRLYVDAQLPSQWRGKGFSPVLNEYADTAQTNRSASLLYRALALKQTHPLPKVDILPDSFDFGLDREQSCPSIEAFDAYAKKKPLAGMPYGLPGISDDDVAVITRWLEAGAPDDGPSPTPVQEARDLAQWERFLNGESLKEQLVARYLYEHLFLAHLYLSADGEGNAYRIRRSSTPPGEPMQIIATRRPFDDPGVSRVYYRLQRDLEPIVAKTHMPYRLDAARMERFRKLFLGNGYTVSALPSYAPDTASNALATFRAMPANARYQFLLDDAQFFVMNFIKGPVCRGQLALNVIEDRFWVFFADPDSGSAPDATEMTLRASEATELPAAWGSDAGLIAPWRTYAAQERKYQQAKAKFRDEFATTHGGPKLDAVWDGEHINQNAALTIFRHFDSATVARGLVGSPPKTAWVMGYPLFERVFYLLAAGFDVYGNVAHQLHTRLYMDFLRMEGESNFLALLPKADREATVAYWYRDARDESLDLMNSMVVGNTVETAIRYRTADHQRELFDLLAKRLGPALDTRLSLDRVADPTLRQSLQKLTQIKGAGLAWLPEASFIEVTDAANAIDPGAGKGSRYFTLLRDTGHLSVTRLLREKSELAPAENAITVAPGLIGAYPNALYRMTISDLPAFTDAVAALKSEADYRALADRFAVRRTLPDFWQHSDALHAAMQRIGPADGGLLDYSRLENR